MRPLLWVTDEWETLDHAHDTTLRLMEESFRLGVTSYWCDPAAISLADNALAIAARCLDDVGDVRQRSAFHFAKTELLKPNYFSSIQYRVDPPPGVMCRVSLQMILEAKRSADRLGQQFPEVVNPPDVLLGSSSKLECLLLGTLTPPTLVSCAWNDLRSFGLLHHQTVIKPLDEKQSSGVRVLIWTESDIAEAYSLVRSHSQDFRRPVLLQRYLNGVVNGELRLWFLDGQVIGAVRRHFAHELSTSSGFDEAGLEASKLTSADRAAASILGKHLRERGIRLCAVDLIDGLAIDMNFASPGLLVEMEELLAINLAKPIIRSLSKRNGKAKTARDG